VQVDILMGTYNGELYIAEQYQSLQAQTHTDWRLWVRDDGSTDGTRALVESLAAADSRVIPVHDELGNLGFNRNFHRLLSLSTAPCVMYCDQDDVWLPRKIEAALTHMQAQQARLPGAPLMVHCDSVVSDSQLKPVSPQFVGRRAAHRGLSSVLMANPAQGATIMLNAPLRALALRSAPVLPFDYHAALIAEATGERHFLPESMLLYRQHARNAIGATGGQRQTSQGSGQRLSGTLRMGLQASPSIVNTLMTVRDQWHPQVQRILEEHQHLVAGNASWRSLRWALQADYQFYRRVDRLNVLLFALGLPSLKA
jgi:hypothetical protein